MDLLKAKRGSETHSDFLDKLGNLLSAAEFDQMTGDEMVIHLFKESADAQMARIAMDILEKENPTMRKLKVKVKETENGVLYSQKKLWESSNIPEIKILQTMQFKDPQHEQVMGILRINHKKEYCKQKDNKINPTSNRANKGTDKKKTKRKKKTSKKAMENC